MSKHAARTMFKGRFITLNETRKSPGSVATIWVPSHEVGKITPNELKESRKEQIVMSRN